MWPSQPLNHKENCPERIRSIMSGDSPNAHRNEIFDIKEGRSSPTPTTSKDVGIQSGSAAVTASVLVEPGKDKDKDDETLEICSPTLNSSEEIPDHDKLAKGEDFKDRNDKDNDDFEKRKLNGEVDKLDGAWKPGEKKQPEEDDEDESCVVKCLYYTLQCCECSIM